ncbi:MAG: hypothetical protein QW767_06060 [Thermoprotei archaeon]
MSDEKKYSSLSDDQVLDLIRQRAGTFKILLTEIRDALRKAAEVD